MDVNLLVHVLIAFGALQAFFLAVILIVNGRQISTRLFAFFLVIEGFTLIERLLAETGMMNVIPHLLGISYPISFLKPAILYFLALSMTQPTYRIMRAQLAHAIPFLFMLLLNVPFYALPGAEKVAKVSAFIHYVPAYTNFNFWFFLSFFLYIGAYLFVSIRALRIYKSHIKSNGQANWFLKVLYLYVGLLLVQLVHFVLRPTGWVEFAYINEVSMLLMTFLIQSIAYNFLARSKLMDSRDGRFQHDLKQLSKDGEKIKKRLETEKDYLNDTLNLEMFAASLSLPRKYVSEVINQSFGTTFKGLINQYRVEQVIALMMDDSLVNVQVTELGLRSGFNNKVSFYRTFKKITGKSPTYYRDTIAKDRQTQKNT